MFPVQYAAVLLAVFSLLACRPSGGDSRPKSIFRYNQPNNITSLDPVFARSQNNIWAVDHLFDGLVQLDDELRVQPSISKDWTISEDGLTYTFILRQDVRFHDHEAFPGGEGRAVTAADVVYSFQRLIDPEWNSPGSWIFLDKVDEARPFEAPNDSTFILRLGRPFRPMLGILSMQYASIVPREVVEQYGKDFRTRPVGTGPFIFVNWIENQSLVLIMNPDYFEREGGDPLPQLDGVQVSFIEDRKTAYLELIKGELDYFSGLESSYVNDLLTPQGALQPKYKDQLQFIKAPYLNMEYLGINLAYGDAGSNPLLKKEVRQALNYAIDRRQMLSTLRNGVGRPANSGFIPAGLPAFAPEQVQGYRYDPQQARTLLAAAGYPDGKGLPPIELYTNKDYLDLCTFIVKQWENLGVICDIELTESGTLRQMMSDGQVALFRASWIADYPDAESFLTVFYGNNPAPPNYTRFNHPRFNRLYEQALQEIDDQKRYALYREMDRILIEEAPVIFLYYDETAVFARKDISGIPENAINLLDLKKVKKGTSASGLRNEN